MLKLKFLVLAVSLSLVFSLVATTPLEAQDDTTRDPAQLAKELLGYDGTPVFPDLSPIYKPGDTLQFWVTKANQSKPSQITAVLADATDGIYLWVEQGIGYDPDKLQTVANRLDILFDVLRIKDNLGAIQTVPQARSDLNNLQLLQIPDVDSDPHLYILFAQDLATSNATIFNPNDSLPAPLAPGGYSNQHELLIANVSAFPGIALDNNAFSAVLVEQMQSMLAFYNNPHQADWLREALSTYMLLQTQQRDITQNDVAAFLSAPQTPLMQLPSLTSTGEEYGGTQLFLRYIRQRYGSSVFHDLFSEPGDGLSALDHALQTNGVNDLISNQPVTAADAFADFAMTNLVNQSFGDGRYLYRNLDAASGMHAPALVLQDNFNFNLANRSASQFGTSYLALNATKATDFTLYFQGAAQTPRLPIPDDGNNHFYWSGSGLDSATSLTRSFDLSNVEKATLTFDAWYNMIPDWNYAYVEVSDDQGQTWKILPTDVTTTVDPYAVSYGPGFTGISNTQPPQPFPALGVLLGTDGLTITQITPGGAVANTTIQEGDVIAGYDGHVWQSTPSVLGLLSQHKPGDTLSLYIQRGSQYLSVDVVLGKSPTRFFPQNSLWLPQQVDLSAYAGKQIQVRFQYISVAEIADKGFAVDNIAIPEISYQDDAESGVQGWTLNGWQQMTNAIPQRFLLEYSIIKSDQTLRTIKQLIGPHDSTTSGQWPLHLDAKETLVLAIAGLDDETNIPATFSLGAQQTSSSPSATATSSAGA